MEIERETGADLLALTEHLSYGGKFTTHFGVRD